MIELVSPELLPLFLNRKSLMLNAPVFLPLEEVKSAIQKTGIAERRVADEKTCASDLCCAAAEALLEEMSIDRNEIDVLIFVSQTPDYRMPVTGTILQDRLGLAKTTAAFDINLGSFRVCLRSGLGLFFCTAGIYPKGAASRR